MTAWSDLERANLRAYLGFPALFRQFEPRLENAIRSVQAIVDGGVLPDNATQERMRLVLVQLAAVDSKLTDTQTFAEAISVDNNDIKVDYIRANFLLKMEGRRLISQLCIPLGTKPFRDYYAEIDLNTSFGGNSWFPTDLG